ncbi:MAG TPA: DUF692 domain-containing protein [Myxococcaceae bacterium]|nr:DUF692 domain-containing protein [Myxococcaceae bacterium]
MVPFLGHGIGLRAKHFPDLLEQGRRADWFEVISENFLNVGGRPRAVLEAVRRDRPVVLHGVSLSVGSVDPLDTGYLRDLRALADAVEPAWVSDHLCWGTFGRHNAHDLLPLPLTEESLTHVVSRVSEVQELLGRRILLENVSSYLTYTSSTLAEWDFLAEVARRADCLILLDVNNVYVSAINHGFDPAEYLRGIPVDRVAQFHLAGHQDLGTHLLDTHDAAVPDPVWALYRDAVRRFGRVSTLVEWDDHIPPLDEVLAEAERARAFEKAVLEESRG